MRATTPNPTPLPRFQEHTLTQDAGISCVLCALLMLWCVLGGGGVAYGQSPLVKKVTISPEQVYLGQEFTLRARLQVPASSRLAGEFPKRIGPATRRGPARIRARDQGVILRVPLAVYAVARFGPLTLPRFDLRLRGPGGTRTISFPELKLKVRASYAASKAFEEKEDPTRLRAGQRSPKEPSTQYARVVPLEDPSRLWLVLLLLVGLLAVSAAGWFIRKRMQITEPPPPPPTPFEVAEQALAGLQPQDLQTPEQLLLYYQSIARTLREYFEETYPLPATKLTPTELHREIQEAFAQVGWSADLVSLLRESEVVCFARFRPQAQQCHEALERAKALLNQLESWAAEHLRPKEEELAALEAAVAPMAASPAGWRDEP